jgi:predicted esterase
MARSYEGSVDGMPVFIGGGDVDPWIKHEWMQEAADVLENLGASVDFRTYPGMPHTVNEDEIEAVQEMIQRS